MKNIILLILLTLQFSCSGNRPDYSNEDLIISSEITDTIPPKSIPIGKIVDTVPCDGAINQTYAVYIPDEGKDKKLPALILFDAHGNGVLPITLYRSLADYYGIILIGSNYSKNGLSEELLINHIKTLYNNVIANLPVDKNAISTAGMSGGARVATLLSFSNPNVNVVIGCGGGLPYKPSQFNPQFSFLGIAGLDDFNYLELIQLQNEFNKKGIHNALLTFNGKHAWPPVTVMRKGIIWILLQLHPKDHTSQLLTAYRNDSTLCTKNKNIGEAFIQTLNIIAFYGGFTDIQYWKQRADELQSKTDVIDYFSAMEKILSHEIAAEQKLAQNFDSEDILWWKKEIDSLRHESKIVKDSALLHSNNRILAYLGLSVYMTATRELQAQSPSVENVVAVYRYLEPENNESWYLSALVDSRKNNKVGCIQDLRHAISLGFDDYKRLSSEKELEFIIKDFPALADSIR